MNKKFGRKKKGICDLIQGCGRGERKSEFGGT